MGAGRQVAVGQRGGDEGALGPELGKLVGETSLACLESGASVAGDEARESFVAFAAEEPGAVEWVEPGALKDGRVSNVVQVRGCGEHVRFAGREKRRSHPACAFHDAESVDPPCAERLQKLS